MAAARSPSKVVVRDQAAAAVSCVEANTTFVQADPATFRALVQRLTGAPPAAAAEKQQEEEPAAVTVPHAPPPRRQKLQERRRAAPARLELARPHPASSPSSSFYYYHHHHHHHGGGGGAGGLMHSPVSPMDAYVLNSLSPSLSSSSSMTPSPHSSSSCGVVISREEEEREEKAIASKGFYLHAASPRSAGDGDRPRLLPLFPLHSPSRTSS
ncbi:hypothetical protein BS78_06G257200 [Paspalum vaginatum]|nr:hypothetical protein BS78_06G249800 [Paspalum vaginatum]KAJ1273134.1 hypothetical protein BS78_06G257200 [Paspalum vaginatum]